MKIEIDTLAGAEARQRNPLQICCATEDDIGIDLYKWLLALLALRILACPVVPAVNTLEILITPAIVQAHLAPDDH